MKSPRLALRRLTASIAVVKSALTLFALRRDYRILEQYKYLFGITAILLMILPALPGDPDEGAIGVSESEIARVAPARSRVGFSLPPTPAMLDWQIHHARVEAEIRGRKRAACCGAPGTGGPRRCRGCESNGRGPVLEVELPDPSVRRRHAFV